MIHMEFFFLDISSFLIKPLIHDLLIKSLIKELIRDKSFLEIKLST